MTDTRRAHRGLALAGRIEFHSGRALAKIAVCLLIASAGAYLPEHAGLGDAARASLWILLLAAGLWISEAIPAFAVALLVIGLQILLLGAPGGPLAGPDEQNAWQTFTDPWAAPAMWLFFAGLVMARSAERTGLAAWIAQHALAATGGRGPLVLAAAMAVTTAFSMFISNTATAALMVAVLGPVLTSAREMDPRGRAALLAGVAFAANLGGMTTIISSPPNVIAAGLLAEVRPISFLEWLVLGAPLAFLLIGGLTAVLALRVRGTSFAGPQPASRPPALLGPVDRSVDPEAPWLWQKLIVMTVFTVTVLLWMTEAWHGLPAAVVSFLPIVALSVTGVIRREDMRALQWDILILLAGGLSLGIGVAESGLARWLAVRIAELPAAPWLLALALCYVTTLLSNLMSNTATANLILPMALALGLELGGPLLAAQFVLPVALAASSGMSLPISTPPNAIVHATGQLGARDLLGGGVMVGLLTPPLAVAWCFPVLAWLGG